jgi:hypothetical protein
MTLADLLVLARRRWRVYALVLVAALTAAVLLQAVPRTYTAESEITFAPPADAANPNLYNSYAETMINYAGVVDRSVDGTFPATKLTAPAATLFGNGVRVGMSVGISTVGNQWMTGFDRPVIVVEVNATTEQQALVEVHQAVQRIREASQRLQDEDGVPVAQRISTLWDEREIAVGSFGNTRESILKGTAVMLCVAVVFATLVAKGSDAIASRRRKDVATS